MDTVYNRLREPGSFGGVHALRRYSGRSERDVRRFLPEQDAYRLHKPRRIRFPRRSQDLLQRHRRPLSDRLGGSVQFGFAQRWHAIPSHVHRRLLETRLGDTGSNEIRSRRDAGFRNRSGRRQVQHGPER